MNRVFIRRVQVRLRRGDCDLDLVLVLACGDSAEVGADFVVAFRTPGHITEEEDDERV